MSDDDTFWQIVQPLRRTARNVELDVLLGGLENRLGLKPSNRRKRGDDWPHI